MNISRIVLGLVLLVGAGGALAVGGTQAFFSDTETSTGNTFTAGAIDLKVDNTSYYNGVLNQNTSWLADDLNNGAVTLHKFFDFSDLKPDDYGEDTISLHAQNDAYLCANVTLTSNNDNTCTEPETQSTDPQCIGQTPDTTPANGVGNGELAGLVNFIWWADDGDNVLESNENVISQGPIGALGVGGTATVTLADSVGNIWTGSPGPIPANTDKFIGKAWCFGAIGAAPLTQDNVGNVRTPAGDNDAVNGAGQPEDGGITCNGTLLTNESQTDSLTADVRFNAIQARNNNTFRCVAQCRFDNTINLMADGGFETPVVVNPAKWDVFPSPVSGWSVAWRSDIPATFGPQTRPAIAKLEFHRGVLGNAFLGDQYTELDSDWGGPSDSGNGEPASVMIYQDIVTIPGVQYKVHFAFAPRPSTPAADNNLDVKFGGLPVYTSGPTAGGGGPIAWTPHDFTVTATTTTTRVQFTDLGTANSLGTFLDDVKLTQESCIQP